VPFFQPIQSGFTKLVNVLGRAGYRGDIKELYSGLLPVALVARDHSDINRPLWGIAAAADGVAGDFSSTSISSSRDIQVLKIENFTVGTGAAPQPPLAAFVQLFTPSAAYVPFDVPLSAEIFTAPLRPTLEFDIGVTNIVAGRNAGPSPLGGMSRHTSTRFARAEALTGGFACVQCGVGVFQPVPVSVPVVQTDFTNDGVYDFSNGPLILPATQFMTVQAATSGVGIASNWYYREL